MPVLGTVSQPAGDADFLSTLSRQLGAIGGANRSSSQATSVGGNANVSVNPTIVNSSGGGASANPTNYASVSGSPSGSGSASVAGDTPLPSWLNTGAVRSMPGPQAGYLDPLTGRTVDAGTDWIIPLAIGAAALFFLTK